MKKYWKMMIGIIVFVFVIVGGLYLWKGDSKEKVLEKYYTLLNQKEYEKMYALIKTDYQKDEFIERNQNIYEGIEAKNIRLGDIQVDKDVFSYTVKMQSIAGEITFQNKTSIKNGKIVWDDSFIYPTLTQDKKVKVYEIKAVRGRILDHNGKELAKQGDAYQVGIVPGKYNKENSEALGQLLGISKESIENALSAKWVKDDSFVPLKVISKDDNHLESQLLTIPGILLNTIQVRIYPYDEITSHVVGYLQKVNAEDLKKHKGEGYDDNSYIGRTGIEAAYEKKLKGINGVEIYIAKNGQAIETIKKQDVQNGEDIVLTIDIDLQQLLYQSLMKDKATAVAINPTNGDVLALVSTPSYSSQDYIFGLSQKQWDKLNDDENQPLMNRYQATWVPGSTMKPITALIGLDDGIIDPQKDLKSEKKWQKDESWGDYYVTTVHAASPNRLKNAIIASDNVYFAKTALMIGKEKLIAGYRKLKIGEEIPFDLSLYSSQYATHDFKNEIQITDSGYGQGEMLMNPVQMACIYGLFVNNGKIMIPHLLASEKSEVWAEPFSQDTVEIVKEDLIQVIEDPKSMVHSFYRDDITFAAKTGTAEIKKSQGDTNGTELGWFNVMTVDNQQPLVASMMIEDAKDKGGSYYASTRMKEALDQYLK